MIKLDDFQTGRPFFAMTEVKDKPETQPDKGPADAAIKAAGSPESATSEVNGSNPPGYLHPSPSTLSITLGNWIHQNKRLTNDNPLGYSAYQYLRSAAASVPYGLSMAATWLAFTKTSKAFGKLKSAQREGSFAHYARDFFQNDYARTGAMIGTSFSLYRATSKIGQWVNDYLFNPEDDLATTIDKVEYLPEMLSAKAKEVYLPEVHSTMVSALVLSGLVTLATERFVKGNEQLAGVDAQVKEYMGRKSGIMKRFDWPAWKHFWKEGVFNPKSKFVPQAAMNAIGYSLFFELGDRRFKDKQMSRGMWAGKTHMIGSSSLSSPSLLEETPYENYPPAANDETETRQAENRQRPKYSELPEQPGDYPDGSRMGDKLSVLTSEPSFIRFFLRRFVPTAIGITGYTALKFRGGKHIFGAFEPAKINSVGSYLKQSYHEGAQTSLFFMIPAVTDKYAPAFDRFVDKLESSVSGRPYAAVVAGYQSPKPKAQPEDMAIANHDNHPAANNDNQMMAKAAAGEPQAAIEKPVQYEARLQSVPNLDREA